MLGVHVWFTQQAVLNKHCQMSSMSPSALLLLVVILCFVHVLTHVTWQLHHHWHSGLTVPPTPDWAIPLTLLWSNTLL